MDRRSFLRQAARAGVGAAGLGALADLARIASLVPAAHAQAVDDYRALICVFMYGGNDGNNLLVPTDAGSYAQYAQGRGRLALPSDQLLPIVPSNAGGRPFGLHPAMADVHRLFGEGRAALVANVGPLNAPTTRAQWQARSVPLPANLFSHDDQQTQWQSAISDGTGRSGWAGRIGDVLQTLNTTRGATCISLAGNNVWELGATSTAYKVSPNGRMGFGFYQPGSSDALSTGIGEMLAARRGHALEQAWLGAMDRAIENQRVLAEAVRANPFTTPFPNTGIGSQLRMAARLIAARTQLGMRRQTFFCSIGGFDTHGDDQLGAQQRLLGEISAAVGAFQAAMVQLGTADKVTTFTASEFGRNLPSNGQGSDHGWGSHHVVVGGAVRGGALYGTFPNLAINGPDDAGDGRWIPTTSVDQFGATLARWLGVSNTEMATVFPNLGRFGSGDLGFMNA